MDRIGIVAVFSLLLIFSDVSNASLFSTFRRFIAADTTNQVSPSPSPIPVQNGSNTTLNETSSLKDPKVVNSSPKGSVTTGTAGSPPQNKGHTQKTDGITSNNDQKKDYQSVVGLNCTGMHRRCKDQNSLVACILSFDTGHKKLVVLVQNEGESILKVEVSPPNSIDSSPLEIPKQEARKINVTVGNTNEVVLKAGYGECVLHTDLPASQGNIFLHLPSYEKLITPINGAYFLIITALIFGGGYACCLFRKRRRQDGVPYQELEMGLPESSLANNVETAEGWDQVWDDDWDEENAVRSPAAHRAGSISANGLTSRAPKKNGWEDDWDD